MEYFLAKKNPMTILNRPFKPKNWCNTVKHKVLTINKPLDLIYKKTTKKNTIFTDRMFMNLSCFYATLHI
ncbi:hypothetical protein AB674_12175 [Flavobacterium sp. ABG]|jgi:hypothetical protein|nr:hypothetical protein AB674_12175 [Flavobacterium sp. ABG]